MATEERPATPGLARDCSRFQRMVECAELIAAEVDVAGHITYVNENGCRLVGLSVDEVIGRPFLELVVEEEREALTRAHLARMSGELALDVVPMTLVHRNGTTRRVRFHTALVHADDGAPSGAVVLGEDITVQTYHERRLRELAVRLADTEDRERRRLSEELHDRVSQSLAVSRMHLSMAEQAEGPDAAEHLAAARRLLEEAIRETRSITTELAPPILYELGLGPGLRWIAELVEESSGLRVALDIAFDEVSLDLEAKTALFRACRELLANAVAHAAATEASVSLGHHDDRVVLTVVDDGCGFDVGDPTLAPSGGFGLFGIRERMLCIGGDFTIESAIDEGTRATVSLPVS